MQIIITFFFYSFSVIGGSEIVDVEKGSGTKNKQELSPALTKSELMKYATDPFWVKLRWALFILFWLIWVGMLVSAVGEFELRIYTMRESIYL